MEIEAEEQPQVLRLPFATLRVAQDDRDVGSSAQDEEKFEAEECQVQKPELGHPVQDDRSFILTGEQGTASIVQAAEFKIQGELH
jgi:hypothetical protein